MTLLANLIIKFSADNAKLISQMDQNSRHLKKFQSDTEKTATSIKSAFKDAFAFISVGLVIREFKEVINLADDLGKLSQKTGVAVEALSALNYSAKLADVSTEQLAVGFKKLAVNQSDALKGTGEAREAFRAIGITLDDLKTKSPDELLKKISDSFFNTEDGAGKAALAVKLFGRAGTDLIPLLNQGSVALDEAAEKARKLGIIIDGDTAKAAERFNDDMKNLGVVFDAFKIQVARDVLPGLTNMAAAFIRASEEGLSFSTVLKELKSAGIGGKFVDPKDIESLAVLRRNLTELVDLRRSLMEKQQFDADPKNVMKGRQFTFVDEQTLKVTNQQLNATNERMLEIQQRIDGTAAGQGKLIAQMVEYNKQWNALDITTDEYTDKIRQIFSIKIPAPEIGAVDFGALTENIKSQDLENVSNAILRINAAWQRSGSSVKEYIKDIQRAAGIEVPAVDFSGLTEKIKTDDLENVSSSILKINAAWQRSGSSVKEYIKDIQRAYGIEAPTIDFSGLLAGVTEKIKTDELEKISNSILRIKAAWQMTGSSVEDYAEDVRQAYSLKPIDTDDVSALSEKFKGEDLDKISDSIQKINASWQVTGGSVNQYIEDVQRAYGIDIPKQAKMEDLSSPVEKLGEFVKQLDTYWKANRITVEEYDAAVQEAAKITFTDDKSAKDLADLIESIRTPTEKLGDEIKLLKTYWDANSLTVEQYNAAVQKAAGFKAPKMDVVEGFAGTDIGTESPEVSSLVESLKTDQEARESAYEAQKELIEREITDEEDRMLVMARLDEQYQDDRLARERDVNANIIALRRRSTSEAVTLLGYFAGKNKAAALVAIALTKGLAIAEVLAHAQVGAVLAYNSQLIAGVPSTYATAAAAYTSTQALGVKSAAFIAAQGLVEGAAAVKNIDSGRGGSSGGGVRQVTPVNAVTGLPAPQAQAGPTINVTITGIPGRENSIAIADEIKALIRDGYRLDS